MSEHTATLAWRPVLTGRLADRAGEIVNDIAEALRERSPEPSHDASLAGGDAGIALFYAYLAHADPRGGHDERSRMHLERAIATLGTQPMSPGLHEGFTGVAWTVEHLTQQASQAEPDDLNSSIDEALEAALRDAGSSASWWWHVAELISGFAGLGIYSLERLPRPSAARILDLIVTQLSAGCERTSEGIAWKTPPEILPPLDRQRTPAGYYNLGVAHGLPGVIGFLGQACAAGVGGAAARELLDGAVSWLRAHRFPRGGEAAFPTWIAENLSPPAARVSWCYGNPGIAVALLVAARSVGERRWADEAVDLALDSAARSVGASSVIDACLCHGSAGNGHLFNRLFQATGDARFRDAAVCWFEQTFEYHKPGSGLAGFETRTSRDDGEPVWKGLPGFLNGVSGIGLALLAATTPVEPAWDRVIVSSIPSQA